MRLQYRPFDQVRFKSADITGTVLEMGDDGHIKVSLHDIDEVGEFFPHEIERIEPVFDLHYQSGIPWLIADRIQRSENISFLMSKWSLNLGEAKILEFGTDKDGYTYFDYENHKTWTRALLTVSRDYLSSVFAVYYQTRDEARAKKLTGKTSFSSSVPKIGDAKTESMDPSLFLFEKKE